MIKNTKILFAVLISILILSMTSIVSADSYTFSLRNSESDTQIMNYTNTNLAAMDVTFEIVDFTIPDINHGVNLREGEITFVFDPATIANVAPGTSDQTELTLTIDANAPLGTYTADVQVNETPTAGGA